MKFLGYLSKILAEIISEEDILLRVHGCIVFKEYDSVKLTIFSDNSKWIWMYFSKLQYLLLNG